MGQIAYEQNDLPQAAAHLNKALALSQQGGLTDDMRLALLLQIRLNLANGEVAAATAAAEQVIAILQAFQVPRLTQFADACRARLQLLQGQTAVATQWAESFANQLATTPSEAQQDFETLTLASICLTQGKLAAAQKVLTQLVEEAQANSRLHTQIEALILQTQVAQAAGNRETAVSHLTQAIHLAAPAGFVRIFLDAGAALATLLPLTRTAAPTFVNQLLAALPEQVSPVPTSPHAVPPPTELLSEQEMNVLQLLCAGRTNREIAVELVITAGTAKWHVHNILQKLDVNSRTQATVRARELGLIA